MTRRQRLSVQLHLVASLFVAYLRRLPVLDAILLVVVGLRGIGLLSFPWSWVLVPFMFEVGVGLGLARSQAAMHKAAANVADVKGQLDKLQKSLQDQEAARLAREWILHPGRPVRVTRLSAGALCVDVLPRFLAGRTRGAEGVMIGETVGGAWLVQYRNGEKCVHLPSELTSALVIVPTGNGLSGTSV